MTASSCCEENNFEIWSWNNGLVQKASVIQPDAGLMLWPGNRSTLDAIVILPRMDLQR